LRFIQCLIKFVEFTKQILLSIAPLVLEQLADAAQLPQVIYCEVLKGPLNIV